MMVKGKPYSTNPPAIERRSELLGWIDDGVGEFGFYTKKDSKPIVYAGPGHRLTLGMTGSGKAVNSAIPELLSFVGNAVVLDVKSELYHVTHRWRRDVLGHRIILIDPFNVTDCKPKDGLNAIDLAPLLGCSTYESSSMLATMFCGATQQRPWFAEHRTMNSGRIRPFLC